MGVFKLDRESEIFDELDENIDDWPHQIGYFQNYEDGPEGWATTGGGSDVWIIANQELYNFVKKHKQKPKKDSPLLPGNLTWEDYVEMTLLLTVLIYTVTYCRFCYSASYYNAVMRSARQRSCAGRTLSHAPWSCTRH